MSKLFIFGIGGTGSRVIKSLTMLLASGVNINSEEVIPIIIDPDRANGDLNRTLDVLKQYQSIRKKLSFEKNSFFKTKISTLKELVSAGSTVNSQISDDFRFELAGVQNERFRDFIDYGSMDESNRALTELLFSEDNLMSDMELGFKGNPNIGSIVLNQFAKSKEFAHFASNFNQNDRIFIISSIFGGTGAAGFPLLLKNIREAHSHQTISHPEYLKKSKIGAVTLLPYFGVSPDTQSKIDKATFISKAKAALSYYDKNISGNKSLNALYYLADDYTKDYENNEGSREQQNDAHFIELAAALSIIDFANIDDEYLQTDDSGAAISPYYKEFGVKERTETLEFPHLGHDTLSIIQKPLTKYKYFVLYQDMEINKSISKQPWSNRGKIAIDNNFLNQIFYRDNLKSFNGHFNDWLKELSRNKRAFSPFEFAINEKNLFNLIKGYTPKKSWNPIAIDNFALYNQELNTAEKSIGDLPVEQKFMTIFSEATDKIISQKFNF